MGFKTYLANIPNPGSFYIPYGNQTKCE